MSSALQDAPVVSVRDLTVSRGRRPVLHGVSFEITAGQLVGLLGPSGCGKTTLMRSLLGVQIVGGGTVRVLGEQAGSPTVRGSVGYMAQALSTYTDLTVRENLRYFGAIVGAPATDVERVMEEVDLGGRAHVLVSRLSGGEQARVSLATALIGSPRLLVLDEPTVGLDPLLRRQLWSLFTRLARQGTALVVSSHVMDEAARCGRLLLMRDGRLLADDTPAGILARTGAQDYESAFVALIEEADR